MTTPSPRFRRKSLRFPDRDYRAAATYILTVCTHGRAPLLGTIADARVLLSDAGCIAREEWVRTGFLREDVELGEFVLMPDHLHALITLQGTRKQEPAPARGRLARTGGSLGSIVAGFKAACTVRINEHRGTPGAPVWQRNYHENYIRSDRHLEAVRAYIAGNPMAHGVGRGGRRSAPA